MKKIMNNLIALSQIEIISNRILKNIIDVCLVVILISLGAFVRIPLPFTPVPITLQTFFVMIGSAYLSKTLAPAALLIYLILGMLGLPVFSGAEGGIEKILGPTGGYLFGFFIASIYISSFIKKSKNFQNIFVNLLIGSTIILILGSLYLSAYFKISLAKGFYLGFLPFIPGELLKIVFASLILQLRRG